jgi:hypothetical protein
VNDQRNESDGLAQPPHEVSDDAPRPDDGGEDVDTTKEEEVPMGFKQGYKLGWRW